MPVGLDARQVLGEIDLRNIEKQRGQEGILEDPAVEPVNAGADGRLRIKILHGPQERFFCCLRFLACFTWAIRRRLRLIWRCVSFWRWPA